MSWKRFATNAFPLSEQARSGSPNLDTYSMKALHVSADESVLIGIASTHLEVLSRMVSIYLNPS